MYHTVPVPLRQDFREIFENVCEPYRFLEGPAGAVRRGSCGSGTDPISSTTVPDGEFTALEQREVLSYLDYLKLHFLQVRWGQEPARS
jgi:hypothetical protein